MANEMCVEVMHEVLKHYLKKKLFPFLLFHFPYTGMWGHGGSGQLQPQEEDSTSAGGLSIKKEED